MGRLMSYAGLLYAGNTADPERAKFYGDVQERITTASSNLLFFTLELNRIDDAALDAAMSDPSSRITGRGSRTSARTGRTSSTIASSNCSTKRS